MLTTMMMHAVSRREDVRRGVGVHACIREIYTTIGGLSATTDCCSVQAQYGKCGLGVLLSSPICLPLELSVLSQPMCVPCEKISISTSHNTIPLFPLDVH